MNEYSIRVNVGELNTIKNKINYYGNDLINIFTKMIKETELTKNFFDSVTGDAFREEIIKYLNSRITFIENNYLKYNDKLDSIINDYSEFYSSVSEMVGDNK